MYGGTYGQTKYPLTSSLWAAAPPPPKKKKKNNKGSGKVKERVRGGATSHKRGKRRGNIGKERSIESEKEEEKEGISILCVFLIYATLASSREHIKAAK